MDATDLARRIDDNLHWFRTGDMGSLEGEDQPSETWAQIVRLWREPDEAFASGVFVLLLGRMAEPESIASLCSAMAAGMKRADVVRALALSDEAVKQDQDISWLPRLDNPPPYPPRFSLAYWRNAFWRAAAIRPKGVWSRVKRRLGKMASKMQS